MKAKNLYIISLIFALFIGIIVYTQKNNSLSNATLDSSTSKATREQLDFLKQEDVRIYTLLQNHGIKKELVEKEKSRYLKQLHNETQKIHHEKSLNFSIQKVIEKVCKDFNINLNEIHIKLYEKPSCAAMNDTTLFINQSRFLKLSEHAQHFVIAHELRHYAHQDGVTLAIVHSMLETLGKKISGDPAHPFNQLSRFIELRADIEAATKNNFYSLAYKTYTKESFALRGDAPNITHPKMSFRSSMAEKLNTPILTL